MFQWAVWQSSHGSVMIQRLQRLQFCVEAESLSRQRLKGCGLAKEVTVLLSLFAAQYPCFDIYHALYPVCSRRLTSMPPMIILLLPFAFQVGWKRISYKHISWRKKNFMPSPFFLLFGWRQYWQWLHCMFTVSAQQLFIHKSKYLSRFRETIVHCSPLQFWDGNDFCCNWAYQQVIFVSLISPITLWVILL